ncbi:MAG: hypothetical protein KC449_27810 [Anaerolineales bacterium]|nr:hypothetical protein [Anaerolineales bacterium]
MDVAECLLRATWLWRSLSRCRQSYFAEFWVLVWVVFHKEEGEGKWWKTAEFYLLPRPDQYCGCRRE